MKYTNQTRRTRCALRGSGASCIYSASICLNDITVIAGAQIISLYSTVL